jgi:hypothetical protein
MRETPGGDDGKGRNVDYSFQLFPPGGGAAQELPSFGSSTERTPIGSGEPSNVVLDAELTPDNQLVEAFFARPLGGASGMYFAYVFSLDGASADVPFTAYRPGLYAPDGPGARRLGARITGSVAGKDLTVSLTGDSLTGDALALRFRFEFFNKGRIGWFLLPGGKPPRSSDYLAPKLPGAGK